MMRNHSADRPPDRETAAPRDKGTAVNQDTKAAELPSTCYKKEYRAAIFRFGDPDHNAAAWIFLCALAGDDLDLWPMLSNHWSLTLAPAEIAVIAWAALRALDPDIAEETVIAALGEDIGPLPTFVDLMADARFWASMASRNALKAHALAAYEAMHPTDQAAFLDHVGDRRAAA